MALYTPPSLPRTPSLLPIHKSRNWSLQNNSLLTPPLSSSLHRRTLPTIAQLDLFPSSAPLTPPSSTLMYTSKQLSSHASTAHPPSSKPNHTWPEDTPHAVDWLDITRTQSARLIAEKTCEMICYLWFSRSSPTSSPYNSPHHTSSFTALQFYACPAFIAFIQKVLETTQVSESVIVLSLYYIHRLKEVSHWSTSGQQGSEFRIAVAALMMANKFLDDNTYTNKTWSEVSGIDLEEINRMEREFLMGIDFELCVRKEKYELWLNLLKGMVMAKERDWQRWQRNRFPRTSRLPHAARTNGSVPRTRPSRIASTYHRARSTSPTSNGSSPYPRYPFVFTAPTASAQYVQPPTQSPTPRPGTKRSAQDAFSPTSATFAQLPSKRPPLMSLQIPSTQKGPPSADGQSPLEPLQSFSKMSLGQSPLTVGPPNSAWMSSAKSNASPETLVAAYRVDEQRSASVPQNLYFYSLTCSPTDTDEESRYRKTRLRYHQPSLLAPVPPSSSSSSSSLSTSSYIQPVSMPLNVQSATSSPHDRHMNVGGHPSLPHFNDAFWQPPPQQQTHYIHNHRPNNYRLNNHAASIPNNAPSFNIQTAPTAPVPAPAIRLSAPNREHMQQQQQQHAGSSPVPAAPFANAGPPGVQLYSSSMPKNSVPAYYQHYYHNHQVQQPQLQQYNNGHRGR